MIVTPRTRVSKILLNVIAALLVHGRSIPFSTSQATYLVLFFPLSSLINQGWTGRCGLRPWGHTNTTLGLSHSSTGSCKVKSFNLKSTYLKLVINMNKKPYNFHISGETSVIALLDRDSIPKQFIESPPKLMRVTSYKYHFTGHTNQQGTSGKKKKSSAAPSKTEDWWYRDSKTEYLHSGWFLCNFSKFGDDVVIHTYGS